ncbi:MAG: CapA family protein [Lachnospiraceae bacterium]|nr:CapA family protein [Lachnospiraceae bacterium]
MISETSIVFTGDIGFDKYMDKRWEDDNFLDASVLDFLKSGNHVVANVEGALSSQDKKMAANSVASLMHSMDPAVTTFLNKIGADIWNLANNHIMDAGAEGMRDTLDEALKCNAKTIGAGMNIFEASTPVYLEEAGGIGLFGVGYQRGCKKATEEIPGSLSWSDMETIKTVIDEIKSKCRWCVVVAHGGEEFTSLPNCYTRKRYMDYLDMGADIVVSHHPHVPMNYETFDNKAIFYSLGNFVFDTDYQRAQYNTEKGVLLKIRFDDDRFSFEPMGILIDRNSERVVNGELPLIFSDVPEEEYKLLEPLSAKAFLEATKKQQIYLKPNQYNKDTSAEEWYENFMEPLRSGRVPGEALDLQIVYPVAQKAALGEWKKSKLENVKKYILDQLDESNGEEG